MDEVKRKEPHLSKLTLILRIACSVYLLYLTFDLIDSAMKTEGTKQVVIICAMIAFTVIAIPLGGFSVKALLQKNYIEAVECNDEEEMESEEDTTSNTDSIGTEESLEENDVTK